MNSCFWRKVDHEGRKKTILLKGEYSATTADRGRAGNGGRNIVSFLKSDYFTSFPYKVKSRSTCTAGSFTTKLLTKQTPVFGRDEAINRAEREETRRVD